MKWDPVSAVATHAAQVLSDPKSKVEDCILARKAISNPFGSEVLDALPDEDIDRMQAEAEAVLVSNIDAGRCPFCGAARSED